MGLKYDTFKKHEREIRELCVKWAKSNYKDKEVEKGLRNFGFTAWSLLRIVEGIIEYEN